MSTRPSIINYHYCSNIAIQGILDTMTALLIDTSGPEGIIVYAKDGKIIQSATLPQGPDLSKNLFPLIATFNNLKFEFIAVGQGPGTFNGTRVGAMTAQALAFGWEIPLIGFSSSLLPNLPQIALETYQSFLSNAPSKQIELVYISPST